MGNFLSVNRTPALPQYVENLHFITIFSITDVFLINLFFYCLKIKLVGKNRLILVYSYTS